MHCSRALHAWLWWELHGNCTKHRQLAQFWHFTHGKSSTFFTSSSSWNLNWLSYIFMYIHICIYIHTHWNLKAHNSCTYLTKTGKRRKNPLCKGLTPLCFQAINMVVNYLKTSAILQQMCSFTYTTSIKNPKTTELRTITLSLSPITHKNTSSYILSSWRKHFVRKKCSQFTLQNKVANNNPSLPLVK